MELLLSARTKSGFSFSKGGWSLVGCVRAGLWEGEGRGRKGKGSGRALWWWCGSKPSFQGYPGATYGCREVKVGVALCPWLSGKGRGAGGGRRGGDDTVRAPSLGESSLQGRTLNKVPDVCPATPCRNVSHRLEAPVGGARARPNSTRRRCRRPSTTILSCKRKGASPKQRSR